MQTRTEFSNNLSLAEMEAVVAEHYQDCIDPSVLRYVPDEVIEILFFQMNKVEGFCCTITPENLIRLYLETETYIKSES